MKISGDSIDSFEKTGFVPPENGKNTDFLVTHVGSGYMLSILNVNDIHSQLLPRDSFGMTVPYEETDSIGGFARLATQSNVLRSQREQSYFLFAGDMFPSDGINDDILEKLLPCINMLSFDCVTLGNHEFNSGEEYLGKYLAGVKCPVVVSNITVNKNSKIDRLINKHMILDINGRRIGFISSVTDAIRLHSVWYSRHSVLRHHRISRNSSCRLEG